MRWDLFLSVFLFIQKSSAQDLDEAPPQNLGSRDQHVMSDCVSAERAQIQIRNIWGVIDLIWRTMNLFLSLSNFKIFFLLKFHSFHF